MKKPLPKFLAFFAISLFAVIITHIGSLQFDAKHVFAYLIGGIIGGIIGSIIYTFINRKSNAD